MSSQYFLSKGGHATAADGRCAMEWVSYLAGEQHSDKPVCVSPVLTNFCIGLNDALAALQPTVIELQRSAFDLLERMLPTEAVRLPVVADAELVCGLR